MSHEIFNIILETYEPGDIADQETDLLSTAEIFEIIDNHAPEMITSDEIYDLMKEYKFREKLDPILNEIKWVLKRR